MLDFDQCYRAVHGRDARFDGWFVTGVTSTGIYCRPSCPAITPKRANVRFFPTAAAAQAAGLRACKRCLPDATPGSPEWNVRADVVARAMQLIADGVIDRDGVSGLARRLHTSERHLHRLLVDEVGAGAQSLARAQRAHAARILIETTDMPFTAVAFSAGFASIRQFNDTVRRVFDSTPSSLRRRRRNGDSVAPGAVTLRLAYRSPLHAAGLFRFIGERAVAGVEELDGMTYRRSLRLPRSPGVVELTPHDGHIACTLYLDDVRDLVTAVHRCRKLLDLDADPVAVDGALREDRRLRPLVDAVPGRRVPGSVDGSELAFRAVLGQQISVAGARTLAGRLVTLLGKPLTSPSGAVTHLFPDADTIAGADLSELGMPASRRSTLQAVATAVAGGEVVLDPGGDRVEVARALLAIPGIGPWTASYVAMRALGDPDAFLPGDLGVKKAMAAIGVTGDLSTRAEAWRPWRSYALQHLWASLDVEEGRSRTLRSPAR
jgi:AraC family transcriptional regulator, regulatory protein of adaptative response / DNA-3-methyladenine glycosylase II